MDQLICASLSHTQYWYEVGMYVVSGTRASDRMLTLLLKFGAGDQMLTP